MPSLSQYYSAFGIKEGMTLDGFTLTNLSGQHKTISRYQEYEYPITLTFKGKGNAHSLVSALAAHVGAAKKVKAIRNYYLTGFGIPRIVSQSGDMVIIESIGHAHRV